MAIVARVTQQGVHVRGHLDMVRDRPVAREPRAGPLGLEELQAEDNEERRPEYRCLLVHSLG